jgi:hypothetical protein
MLKVLAKILKDFNNFIPPHMYEHFDLINNSNINVKYANLLHVYFKKLWQMQI